MGTLLCLCERSAAKRNLGNKCYLTHSSCHQEQASSVQLVERTPALGSSSGLKAAWQLDSLKWRSSLDVPPEFEPWTPGCHARTKNMGKRARDLLDCSAMQIWKRSRIGLHSPSEPHNVALKDVLVDFSQSHSRRPYSNTEGTAHCLTTSSQLYSFRLDRCLLAVEHLLLQGYPVNTVVPEGFNDRELRALAGEGIALPCLATLVWAVFLYKGFP